MLRYVQKAASELRDQTLVTQMAVLIACARLDVTHPTVIDSVGNQNMCLTRHNLPLFALAIVFGRASWPKTSTNGFTCSYNICESAWGSTSTQNPPGKYLLT